MALLFRIREEPFPFKSFPIRHLLLALSRNVML
jgi:hypothetical protein